MQPAAPRRWHGLGSISPGTCSDLPAGAHVSPSCPQPSFEHAQNLVRVSCVSLPADVHAEHQQEARSGRKSQAINPLEESRLAVDRLQFRASAFQMRAWNVPFAGKERCRYCQPASFLRAWSEVYEESEGMLRVSYCLPAGNLRAGYGQVAGVVRLPLPYK